MSDFAGILRFDGKPVLDHDLAALSSGPPAGGIHRPRKWRSGNVGFVHARRELAPEDRDDLQPRLFAAAGQALVFDGRLDDRAGLASALNRHGGSNLPDSDLVAQAIEAWGIGAPEKLLGDFAYAHWDQQKQCLTLVRDRVGQRSLYYYLGERFVAFATTIRPLLALPEVPREFDDVGLANFLALNPFDEARTIYRDIFRVPPAHALSFADGRCQSRRYWRIDPSRQLRFKHDDDYIDAARALLDEATRDRLRIVGPPVVMTSGGLDSAGVAATAARLASPDTVVGLSAVPPEDFSSPAKLGKYADERPYVRLLGAMHPNLQIETIAAGDGELVEDDPRSLFALTGMPLRNVHGVAWFGPAWRRAAELGARTLLTGDFGNMSLSYSGLDRIDGLRTAGKWSAWASTTWQFARANGFSPWRTLIRQLIPRGKGAATTADWDHYSALSVAFASEINLGQHFAQCSFDPAQSRLSGNYASQLIRMLEASSLSSDGRSAIRAVSGLTLSDPLSDTRLLEFCAALPPEQYLNKGRTRWLARRVLADRLPTKILENTRRGEQCPEWFARMDVRRDQIFADIERLKASPGVSRILDTDRLKVLVETWPANAIEAEAQVDAYRFVLARGLHMGQFIRWVEGAND